MTTTWQPPTVGDWFQLMPEPPFEVVAVDGDAQTVEIQYFDGTVEEIDFDNWASLPLIPAAEPEDWRGALDVSGIDGDLDTDVGPPSNCWRNPLDNIDSL